MLLTPLLLTLGSLVAPAPADTREVRKQFVELAGKQDRAGVQALWRAHPTAVLPAIDADLEGSLRLREKSADADPAAITALQQRALWGATAAVEGGTHPLLLDYASAFVGWNEAEQKRFREGQKLVGASGEALAKGDAQAALEAAQQALQRTGPLGDWWGSQMACDAIAAAEARLGHHEKALESASFARVLARDLGLAGDEYGALRKMVESARALGRTQRARAACDAALPLARQLGDEAGLKELEALHAQLAPAK